MLNEKEIISSYVFLECNELISTESIINTHKHTYIYIVTREENVLLLSFNMLPFPDFRYAFDRYSTYRINSRKVRYDFQSIMHYGKYAFSNNRKATIVARSRNGVTQFGNTHLSPLDVKQTNLVYNCKGKKN